MRVWGGKAPTSAAGLWRNRRGSTIAMMAAGLIPVIAALGSAIDTGRIYVVKSQLQAGADAAALAGARAYEVTTAAPNGRDAQAKAYFDGNFPSGYMGSTQLVVTPTFTRGEQPEHHDDQCDHGAADVVHARVRFHASRRSSQPRVPKFSRTRSR